MLYTKVVMKDSDIKGERLELTDKKSLYFLGPHLTLRDCTIVLSVPARDLLIRNNTRFINCTFEVKQELKNHQDWVCASLQGCRFKGRFYGCDFGSWPGYDEWSEHGSIADCDFSEARLDACRIMGGDLATLRFPKWPCFTLLEPIRRAPELRGGTWPGLFGRIIVDDLHTQPAPTRAVTYHAPSLAKRMETTEEALRAAIEPFDCIIY